MSIRSNAEHLRTLSNPEGINQYTHGGAALAELADNASGEARLASNAARDSAESHQTAMTLHSVAARAHVRAERNGANASTRDYHKNLAESHWVDQDFHERMSQRSGAKVK